jgi:fructose-1-phosphate kinase PfkB-like protein
MRPIVTLTLNPAVDSACEADRAHPMRKVRTRNERYDAGGGGISAARVINEPGGRAFDVYLGGGKAGDVLDGLVAEAGVPFHRIRIAEPTRVSHVVRELATRKELRPTPEGPAVTEPEWRAVLGGAMTLAMGRAPAEAFAMGVRAQDDSLMDKEVRDLASTPDDKCPLLLHHHPLDPYRH